MAQPQSIQQMLNKRVRDLPPPPNYARLKVATSIGFGGGLPDADYYPMQDFVEIASELLGRNEPLTYSYAYEQGDPELRAAIAHRAARDGVKASADDVVITNGCSGALELAAAAVIDPGDVVLVEATTYPMAVKTFVAQGARIETVPLNAEGLDAEALERVVEQLVRQGARVKMLYTIASTQSPTGTTLPVAQRHRVVEIARKYGFIILQDDTYGEIRYRSDLPPPFMALAPERTIHAASFSKTLAPGLRAGWILTSPEIADAIVRIRTDLGTSPIVQRTIARMLTDGRYDRHLAAMTELYRRKRDKLDEALRTHCGDKGTWKAPDAGFFLWFKPFRNDMNAIIAQADKAGVNFLAGPHFVAKPGEGDSHGLRLAFGQVPYDQIETGIRRLASAVSEDT